MILLGRSQDNSRCVSSRRAPPTSYRRPLITPPTVLLELVSADRRLKDTQRAPTSYYRRPLVKSPITSYKRPNADLRLRRRYLPRIFAECGPRTNQQAITRIGDHSSHHPLFSLKWSVVLTVHYSAGTYLLVS